MIIQGRYWNVNGMAIAIVASVTQIINEPFDWAAYIGGTSANLTEEETTDFARRQGAKLHEKDARHFFPELHEVPYRP